MLLAYCKQIIQNQRKTVRRAATTVEFTLHPQHETSRDSEIPTKEDFKSKFRKEPGSLSIISLNSKDKEEALEC